MKSKIIASAGLAGVLLFGGACNSSRLSDFDLSKYEGRVPFSRSKREIDPRRNFDLSIASTGGNFYSEDIGNIENYPDVDFSLKKTYHDMFGIERDKPQTLGEWLTPDSKIWEMETVFPALKRMDGEVQGINKMVSRFSFNDLRLGSLKDQSRNTDLKSVGPGWMYSSARIIDGSWAERVALTAKLGFTWEQGDKGSETIYTAIPFFNKTKITVKTTGLAVTGGLELDYFPIVTDDFFAMTYLGIEGYYAHLDQETNVKGILGFNLERSEDLYGGTIYGGAAIGAELDMPFIFPEDTRWFLGAEYHYGDSESEGPRITSGIIIPIRAR